MIGYETRQSSPANAAERFYWSRQRNKRSRSSTVKFPVTFEHVISREHLFNCFQELQRRGGPAAGLDGVRPIDVSPSEFGQIAGSLSTCLRDGTYRPTPTRSQLIPKSGSSEMRELQIGNLCDRVVGKAVHSALSPAIDEAFLEGSWGFRPNRNTWGMLADLLNTMVSEKRWVLAIDDVRHAFDNVRIDDALDAHRKLLANDLNHHFSDRDREQLLELVNTVLRGANPERKIGIDQGNPYSPTALNVLLQCVHDVPLQEEVVFPSWFRYADNLVYACHDVSEGHQMLAHVRHLLHGAGLQLKGDTGVRNLSARESCPVLGFEVAKRTRKRDLTISPGEGAWSGLKQHLEHAHEAPRPEVAARAALLGWIESCGPAFEVAGSSLPMVLHTAAAYGFREIAHPDEIRDRWHTSWERWNVLKRGVLRNRML